LSSTIRSSSACICFKNSTCEGGSRGSGWAVGWWRGLVLGLKVFFMIEGLDFRVAG